MGFLVAMALGSGIITAMALAPISTLAALIAAPLVASLATVLAGIVLAQRRTTHDTVMLDMQTDAMVAALKSVASRAEHSNPVRGSKAA